MCGINSPSWNQAVPKPRAQGANQFVPLTSITARPWTSASLSKLTGLPNFFAWPRPAKAFPVLGAEGGAVITFHCHAGKTDSDMIKPAQGRRQIG